MRKTIFTAAMALVGVAAVTQETQGQTTHTATVATAPDPDLAPAKVFSDNCAACHQEDGKGIEGAFPALAGDAFVLGNPKPAIHVVLEGRAGMPTFKADLTDAQIAAALTHVRTAWGNAAGAVTPAMVKAQRDGEGPTDTQKPISAH